MSKHQVAASITGVVARLEVGEGQQIVEGQAMIVLESMKMEIPVEAPATGRVQALHVNVGDLVEEGRILAIIES